MARMDERDHHHHHHHHHHPCGLSQLCASVSGVSGSTGSTGGDGNDESSSNIGQSQRYHPCEQQRQQQQQQLRWQQKRQEVQLLREPLGHAIDSSTHMYVPRSRNALSTCISRRSLKPASDANGPRPVVGAVVMALVVASALCVRVPCAQALAPKPSKAACDLSTGQWKYSPSKRPRYSGMAGAPNFCAYMRSMWNCDMQRRPDKWFQRYRWQPRNCSLSEFVPSGFRFLMKRKKMVIIGDSLMANMFEALVCLLAQGGYEMEPRVKRFNGYGPFRGYFFPRFSFTLLYKFSPYLTNAFKNSNREETGRPGGHGYVVDVDKVDPAIKAALPYFDAAVFSTATWWMQTVPGRASRNTYRVNGQPTALTDLKAHGMGLATLVQHIRDTDYSGVPFFMSISPKHKGLRWPQWPGACGATRPVKSITPLAQVLSTTEAYYAEQKAAMFKSPVRMVKVTRLSARRPDGHIGRWVNGFSQMLATRAGATAPALITGDCTHWCLPGVPDTWVDLLYSHMLLEPSLLERL